MEQDHSVQVLITNKRGLHARAAAKFVKTAEMFDAEVLVYHAETEPDEEVEKVSGRSIMGLMMLAASPGTRLTLSASGVEADAVLDALATLVAEKFHEE
nr:HPr family phosphocarrier protein [Elstera litoralis]